MSARLWSTGRVHPGDDQQEQEQQYEVDLAGEDQVRAHQDGGGHPEPHDDAGGVDKDACAQFSPDGDRFVFVDLLIQPLQIPRFLIGGPDLPDIFQCLLDAVGYPERRCLGPLRSPGGELPGAKEQGECHRNPPEAGDGQPPVIHQQANGDDSRGDIGPPEVPQHMAPDMLHPVHISHDGLR